jgi:hypothetical protein
VKVSRSVAEAIGRLRPPPDAGDRAWDPAFAKMADVLLRRATLFIAGRPHRLTEIELYYFGEQHRDPFAHRAPIQDQLGVWYFHLAGTSYRGGSYKGLDITFGRANAFGGILLRSAESLDDPLDRVEGPSLLVDRILRLTRAAHISDLVARFDLRIDSPSGKSPLHLAPSEPRDVPVYRCARVGLLLKRGDLDEKSRWLARPYRFLTDPARTKKGKPQLVVALHQAGAAAPEIARITGVREPVVRRYLAAYERGLQRSPRHYEGLTGDLSAEGLAELLGACRG